MFWITVPLAAVVYYALGALWFGPLWGTRWAESLGLERSGSSRTFPVSYYVVPAIGAIVTTAAIAVLTAAVDGGVAVGAAVGVCAGVAAGCASVTNAFTPTIPHPFLFGAVTGGYHVVGATVAGALVGI